MSYLTITWLDEKDRELKHLLDSCGTIVMRRRKYRVSREGLIQYQKDLQSFIDEHIKSQVLVTVPLIWSHNSIEWHEASNKRNINVDFKICPHG